MPLGTPISNSDHGEGCLCLWPSSTVRLAEHVLVNRWLSASHAFGHTHLQLKPRGGLPLSVTQQHSAPCCACSCKQVVERFLHLRARLPPDQIAQYCRQEHLNETDSQLLAQSLAEMVRSKGRVQHMTCGLLMEKPASRSECCSLQHLPAAPAGLEHAPACITYCFGLVPQSWKNAPALLFWLLGHCSVLSPQS